MKEAKLGIRTRSLFAKLILGVMVALCFSGAVTDGAERPFRKLNKSPHDQLVEALKLTPSQLVEWKSAFTRLDALAGDKSVDRAERFRRMAAEGRKVQRRIMEILTPRQKRAYLQHRQERAQAAVQIKQERRQQSSSQRMNVVPRSIRGASTRAKDGE